MASKMTVLQTLVVLVWVCLGVVTACPSECTCGPYTNRFSTTDIYVDCSGRGLNLMPTDFPPNTRSINLANNRLTTIRRDAFSNLNLDEINLSGNYITEVPRRSLRITGRCTFRDLEHRMNYRQRVTNGEWHIHDFVNVSWPCAIDLRNNPIFRIDEDAFGGSHDFSVLLGQSAYNLTIKPSAFMNTANMIGLHISSVPRLTLSHGSFTNMKSVYWMIINDTDVAITGPPFIRNTSTSLRWFRISNSNILQMGTESLVLTMDTITDCFVKAYRYPDSGSGPTRAYRIYMDQGGVEIINNTLPVLPHYLFGRSNLGGVYFKNNKIAGFQVGVFARKPRYNYNNICIIRFVDNQFPNIPSGAFNALRNVTDFSITGGNFTSIEANAFANSGYIGRLVIDAASDIQYEQVIVKSHAFADINGVKEFYIGGEDHEEEKDISRLLLQPNAFNPMKNVEYMIVGLHDNMDELPRDLFRGLTVNQRLELRVRRLTRIDSRAFGTKYTGTRISSLYVNGKQNMPCDCEAAELNVNLEETVGKVQGLTCATRSEDGIYHYTTDLDSRCSACSLRFSLVLILLTYVFLNL